jgi:hypothetical protein
VNTARLLSGEYAHQEFLTLLSGVPNWAQNPEKVIVFFAGFGNAAITSIVALLRGIAMWVKDRSRKSES